MEGRLDPRPPTLSQLLRRQPALGHRQAPACVPGCRRKGRRLGSRCRLWHRRTRPVLCPRGHAVTGFDFLEEPIAAARRKAVERSLIVKFLVKDALKLHEWTERFDNVIDSGLFHVFSDTDRIRYVRGLENILNPGARLFLLCFSDATPGMEGPRRVSQSELRHAFADGWEIESL